MLAARGFDYRLGDRSAQKLSRGSPSGSEVSESVRYLRQNEFALWDEFVDISPQGSLFVRSWWLQAVGKETRVLVCIRNGRIVAGIPLLFENRYGLKVCRMPKLTPIWGVLLPPRIGKSTVPRFRPHCGARAAGD
jgi:hypothetical protein